MKRIISAIAVVAIVSGALAFSPNKNTSYCIATTSGGTCNVVSSLTETSNGHTALTRYKYASWTGTQSSCDNAGTNCTTQITLYTE